MFLNEARLAARLDHPNIVSIFDLGEANGNYFIAMEFIDGPSLRAVAKRASERGEYLPIPEVCKIVAMAAGGLEYAHDLTDPQGKPLGLVHRDISPDNILVHRNGAAKVVDFGIAKAANSAGATRTGTLKGKVAYMPPEQLRGEQLDRRTDVFALGVVLYEMLAGKRPWEGDSEVALIGRIMSEEPAPLGAVRTDAPQELLDIVGKCLTKDRAARFQSCAQVQAELENLLIAMGQNITPARVSDFVKAYSPEAISTKAGDESTGAMLRALEKEMNGTGTALPPSLLDGGRRVNPSAERTRAVAPPAAPKRGASSIAYGLVAFLAIALAGGAGGYYFFFQKDDGPDPVAVEQSSLAAKPAPPPPVEPAAAKPAEAPVTPPKPVEAAKAPEPVKPEPVKPEAAKPPEQPPARVAVATPPPAKAVPEQRSKAGGKRARKNLAEAEKPQPAPAEPPQSQPETQPTPVVIVKEAPKPAPAVIAKGELKVLVRPWARIEVDGREIGVTPLADPLFLTAGDHQVRLINPDLGKDVVRTVHITANDTQTVKEILDE
jgi:serine/threonine-protein kinase